MRAPLVIAHRGASVGRPGNTLEAFEGAIDEGADMLEFDIRRTRDAALVVVHDSLVHGVPVGRLTRADIGERTGRVPPTLREVLDLAAGRIALDVELKETGYVEDVLAELDGQVPPGDLLVTSFHARVVREVKLRDASVRAGFVLGVANFGSVAPVARARRCGADVVLIRRRFADSETLDKLEGAGLAPMVWTINDHEGLREALADPRVAGVVTDVPARAIALRDARPSSGTRADR